MVVVVVVVPPPMVAAWATVELPQSIVQWVLLQPHFQARQPLLGLRSCPLQVWCGHPCWER
jgi:hypothetical protein